MEETGDASTLIASTCASLKLPTFTRMVSQAVFHKVHSTLADVGWEVLALMCVYLGAKISDSFVDPTQFKNATGQGVIVDVEVRISNAIDFTFDFPDLYALVRDICKTLKLESDTKMQKLDLIFSDARVNSVNLLGGELGIGDVCMAVLSDKEIRGFEEVYCAEVDMSKIEKVRSELRLDIAA